MNTHQEDAFGGGTVGAPEPTTGRVLINLSEAAREFDLARETIKDRLQRAGVVAARQTPKFDAYFLRDVVQAVFRSGAAEGAEGLQPHERLSHWRAANERLKAETTARTLVPADEMAAEVARIVKIMLGELEPLPDRLERDTGLTPQQAALVELAVDKVREAIYARVIDPPPHPEPEEPPPETLCEIP